MTFISGPSACQLLLLVDNRIIALINSIQNGQLKKYMFRIFHFFDPFVIFSSVHMDFLQKRSGIIHYIGVIARHL